MALSKKIKATLKKAKLLEEKQPMTRKQMVKNYKEGISLTEKLKSLLKPAWFIKDVHKKKKKSKRKKSSKKKKVKRKKKKK